MTFRPQTRTNDAVLPDELPRLSQIGLAVDSQVFGMAFFDGWNNLEVNNFFSAQAASTSDSVRQLHMCQAGTMSLYSTNLQGNGNSIDGATMTIRIDQVPSSLVITLDQASGFIQNTTDSAVFAVGENCDFKYNQGNATVNSLSMMARYVPT